MDRNNGGGKDIRNDVDDGLYRAARFFFVEDNVDDVEFGSNPLGLPAASSPRNNTNSLATVSLHSMIPDDDSETESSSSSSSCFSSSSSSSSSSIDDNDSGIVVINASRGNDNMSGNNVNVPSKVEPHGNEGKNILFSSRESGDKAINKDMEKNKKTVVVEKPINVVRVPTKETTTTAAVEKEKEKDSEGDECTFTSPVKEGTSSDNSKPKIWNTSRIFLRILTFCNCSDLCSVMLVCKRFHHLATRDTLWKGILNRMNLQPLLSMPESPTQDYYQYFIHQIITTKAIHGHYFFMAATPPEGTFGIGGFNQIVHGNGKWDSDDDYDDDDDGRGGSVFSACSPTADDDSIYTVESITLRLSSALLGQINHSIGRVQMLIGYKDKVSEIIQGAARFSWRRGCFVFCCSSFGSTLAGPIFTVAINTVQKPWPNQSKEQFSSHKGGLRFIMTPVLPEGAGPESRINETDILSVSRALINHNSQEHEVAQT
ncbi:uncharacterized protein TM35_000022480 [Trypanosoma theileri]|uniref:F-box domain-containing protein n=1 Tax=Trypanosoma theileri TaxID=67003 RepID=A0A1X0P7L0_9TRYP|nr:uncharacterized protein TM35_000022480 [Trypanosoma theileri]ORC92922.1 hypothetical protein TM35_000022480 [Trypanosoma theileri]